MALYNDTRVQLTMLMHIHYIALLHFFEEKKLIN